VTFLRELRRLVLGETRILPAGVAVAVGAAAAVRAGVGADGWWEDAGGFVLMAMLLAVLVVSVRPR
jgi:hypothetical protein